MISYNFNRPSYEDGTYYSFRDLNVLGENLMKTVEATFPGRPFKGTCNDDVLCIVFESPLSIQELSDLTDILTNFISVQDVRE